MHSSSSTELISSLQPEFANSLAQAFQPSGQSFGTPFLGNMEGTRRAEDQILDKLALATVSCALEYMKENLRLSSGL